MTEKTHKDAAPSGGGHNVASMKLPQNHCFGCGDANPDGMQLHFEFDAEGKRATCHFTLSERYQGPPGHAHGGIIATILDEAMGKVNKLYSVVALTKRMEVDYKKPVPIGKPLTVVGFSTGIDGRKHSNAAEILDAAGTVLAKGEGLFIAVDAEEMFARYTAAKEKENAAADKPSPTK